MGAQSCPPTVPLAQCPDAWTLSFPTDAMYWARIAGVCIPLWIQFNIRGYKSSSATSIRPQRVQIDTNRCSDTAYEYCFVYAFMTFAAASGLHGAMALLEATKSFVPMFPRYIERMRAVDYRRTAKKDWMRCAVEKVFANSTLREKFKAIGVHRKLRPHSLRSVSLIWALRSKLEWPVCKQNLRFVGSNDKHADKYAQRAQASLVSDMQGRQQDPLYRFWRMTAHVISLDVLPVVPLGIDFSDDEDELDPPVRNVRQRVVCDADSDAMGSELSGPDDE